MTLHANRLDKITAGIVVFMLSQILLICDCPAQEPEEPEQVLVTGERPDPEKISYDTLLDAVDLFEKNHAHAPGAVLQFRLIPRHKFNHSELRLSIKTKHEKIPINLNENLLFTLPVIERLRDKDAYLVVNKNSGNFVWSVYIHAPEADIDSIRLGDLRTTCRINLKSGLSSFMGPTGSIISKVYEDPCLSVPTINQASFAAFRPVFGVTLIDGNRKQELESRYLWRSGQQDELTLIFMTDFERAFLYEPPTRDVTWSDATQLVFTYMDDDVVAASENQNEK